MPSKRKLFLSDALDSKRVALAEEPATLKKQRLRKGVGQFSPIALHSILPKCPPKAAHAGCRSLLSCPGACAFLCRGISAAAKGWAKAGSAGNCANSGAALWRRHYGMKIHPITAEVWGRGKVQVKRVVATVHGCGAMPCKTLSGPQRLASAVACRRIKLDP